VSRPNPGPSLSERSTADIWRLVDRLRKGPLEERPNDRFRTTNRKDHPDADDRRLAAAETFGDPHALAQKLASELMAIEQVPDIPMFRKNTAAFVHELPPSGISNVDGDSTYVRVQVLTNAGALDRAKQLAVVSRFSAIVGEAAGDPSLAERTWVLLTEAIEGGWGLAGHANTNEELVAAARAQIAELQSKGTPEA
jgi:phenylpyruvate tautomerase PptA (4-oxalocrotonate tautomerase family)